jgi:thioredoxin 1
MANRFSVKLPWSEDPERKEVAQVQVPDVTEKDYEAQVVAAGLPVVLDFYGTDKASHDLGPRFAAVAGKFAGKALFLKVASQSNAALCERLAVTASPTLLFLRAGKEKAERLTGDDIKRTELKARVEELLGLPAAPAA